MNGATAYMAGRAGRTEQVQAAGGDGCDANGPRSLSSAQPSME